MEPRTEYGTYGERLAGAKGAQMLTIHGRAFLVTYTFERWSDILGTYEVLEVQELVDAYGMGNISLVSLDDAWMGEQVIRLFRETMTDIVNTAMGLSWKRPAGG